MKYPEIINSFYGILSILRNRLMAKILAIFCLFSMISCQPSGKYTTNQEYIEEQKWDGEKGLVKNSKGTLTIKWD